jgi:ABC-type anion transport system duplicated permease subunit
VVGVIDAVAAGVIAFIGARALGLDGRFATVLDILVAILWNVALSVYQARTSRRDFTTHTVISPTPDHQPR